MAKRSSPTSYCARMMWQRLNKLFIDCMINPELSPTSGLNSSSAVTVKKNYLWQALNYNAGSDWWMHARNAHCIVSTVSLRNAQVSAQMGTNGKQKSPLFWCSLQVILLCAQEERYVKRHLYWWFTQNHQHCEDLDGFSKILWKLWFVFCSKFWNVTFT